LKRIERVALPLRPRLITMCYAICQIESNAFPSRSHVSLVPWTCSSQFGPCQLLLADGIAGNFRRILDLEAVLRGRDDVIRSIDKEINYSID
jgi:hypothetical protein